MRLFSFNSWITNIVSFVSGAYKSVIKMVNEPGLGGRLTIGLDETARALVICDYGDMDTDFGLTPQDAPALYIFQQNDITYRGRLVNESGNFKISTYGGNAGIIIDPRKNITSYIRNNGTFSIIATDAAFTSATKIFHIHNSSANFTGSSIEQSLALLEPTINQTGTAAYNALKIDVTETALGDGSKGDGNNLINLAVSGTCKFRVDSTGGIFPVGMKSGTDQAAAGAAAGELYVDTDTNAVMIGT